MEAEQRACLQWSSSVLLDIDFAYLALTIGITFQVSDTDPQTKAIRRIALRHALLAYCFGSLIIASIVNPIAGLGK